MPFPSALLLHSRGAASSAIANSTFNARVGVRDTPSGAFLATGADVAHWYATSGKVAVDGSTSAPTMNATTAPGLICPQVGGSKYFTLAVNDSAATLEGGMVVVRFSTFGTLHQVIANRPTSVSGTTKSAFFLAVTDTGSAVKIECAVSIADAWKTITDTTSITYADKLLAMALHYWIDRTAGTINLVVNGGSVQSLSLGGTPNVQSGPVYLFSEYTSGAPVASDDTLVVLGASLRGTAVAAADLTEFAALEASLTAPVMTDGVSTTTTVVSGSTTDVDLSAVIKDPTGYDWAYDSIVTDDPNCTVIIKSGDAQTLQLTPQIAEGTAAVVVKLKTADVFAGTTTFTLNITINAVAAGTAFSNGFTNRYPLMVGVNMVEGTAALADYLQRVRITSASLKTTGNGGKMQDSAAKDFRIELAGTKIPHKLLTYDGLTTGTIEAVVLRSSLQNADGNIPEAFWGKDVSGVSEEDAAGAFVNEAFFLDMSTGVDLTGTLAGDLTISGVTAGTGPYGNAGVMDGSHYGTRAEQVADDLAAVVIRGFVKFTDLDADHSILTLGTDTSFSSTKLAITADKVGFHTGHTNTITAEIQSTDARNRIEGQSGLFTTGLWQQFAVRAANGAAPVYLVDRTVAVNSDTSQANNLGGNLDTASPIEVGKGPTSGLRGSVAYICADKRATPIPNEHVITEWRNGRWIDAFCGGARVETADVTTRLIAASMWATTTTLAASTLDPVASSVGTGTLALTGTPTATAGTVAIASNKLSFTAPATPQIVTIGYSLTDGTYTVSGTILVDVTQPSGTTYAAGAKPTGFTTLVTGFSPTASDTTFDAFMTRVGAVKKFGESPSSPDNYGLATSSQTGIFPAIKILAKAGTHGVNGGILLPGMNGSTTSGGPPHGFFRIKIWWPSGYDFNPHWPDGSRVDSSGRSAGGTKFAGPWGGLTPATGANVGDPGFALRGWTGLSINYVVIGLDVYSPRGSGGFAVNDIYRPTPTTTWRIDQNQGRWIQLEWEVQTETAAGGKGRLKFWIDGVLGIDDSNITFFEPADWVPGVGIKGVYLQNWWGGGGIALVDTPIYYKDIELWKP